MVRYCGKRTVRVRKNGTKSAVEERKKERKDHWNDQLNEKVLSPKNVLLNAKKGFISGQSRIPNQKIEMYTHLQL